MNKNTIYIGLALVIGLGLGFVFFGNTEPKGLTEGHNHDVTEDLGKWTCSMHLQIVRDAPGACPICGMSLIPIDVDDTGFTGQQFQLTKTAAALANVETSVVGEGSGQNTNLILSGAIQVNADKIAVQPAHFNGRIDKMYVTSVGQKVSKGQLVAVVYSPALISAQQELITAYKMKTAQPELYAAVRNKFKNWMIHDTQLNSIETSGTVINQFKIYSHVSGTVSDISVKEGDHVMDGKPIFKVANLSTVWAEFDAYENQIGILKTGQPIEISAKAYPNTLIKSKITFIDPILNAATRTITVRAVLENKDEIFKPGMFIEGVISNLNNGKNAQLTIPASAVMWTGKRSVVYLKVDPEQPVFEMREVTLGSKLGDAYEVLDGVYNGNVIVTNGTFTVDAAAQLKGKASMMNQNQVSNVEENTVVSKQITTEAFKAVSEAFQKQIETIFYSYILLKNSLVVSDLELAKVQAKQLQETVNAVDAKSISEHAEMMSDWLVISNKLKKDIAEMQNINTIAAFRSVFSRVSLDLMQGIEKYGIQPKVFVQFCPMANQNQGGYWLSLDEEIENPYYGKTMLGCGENDKILE